MKKFTSMNEAKEMAIENMSYLLQQLKIIKMSSISVLFYTPVLIWFLHAFSMLREITALG